MGRGDLDRIGWGRNNHDLDAGTKNEPADDELSKGMGGRNNDRADNNNPSTSKHALASAKVIGYDSAKGGSYHGTAIALALCKPPLLNHPLLSEKGIYIHSVKRGDDGDLLAFVASVEDILIVVHGQNRTHEGAYDHV